MPKISTRGITVPASPIRKLVPYADAAKKDGVTVYHLNIGQPDLPTPQKALDALKHIDRTTLEYSPSDGYLSLREKLVGYYGRFGIKITPDDVLVTTGGSEALLMTFMACMDPGDEIIMVEPGYANYLSFAAQAGLNVLTVTSRIEDDFALPDVEAFEEVITPKTRAILICNPNNPTGYLYSKEELYRLRDIVRKYDLYLFSDEVYREFCYSDEPYISAMDLEGIGQNVIVVDSMSKRYSECGIRIGNIITRNKDVRESVMKFAQARLSPPLLGQIVAEASIEGTEEYAKQCYEEYLARRNFFIAGLNAIPGVYTPMPQGAFYTTVALPVEDAEDFCQWLLTDFRYQNETVMLAPAAGFYCNPELGKNQVRMAYVLKIEDLAKALVILEKALAAYNSR